MEKICAQRIQRDLVEPKGTQQIVPVAQTSTKVPSKMTNYNDSDQANTSGKTLKFPTSQSTFVKTNPCSQSTGDELFKLPTSQRESQLKSLQPSYNHKKFGRRTSGHQLQLIPSSTSYPQASPISRRTITSRQGASSSPSSKLNQSKAAYQVLASIIEQDVQHFQSILKMPETLRPDLSYKRSPISKVTRKTELTEKSKPYYEKSRNSNYAGTVTKPVTSNELNQLTSPWLLEHNYSREFCGIKSRELIHLPTSRMEPKFVSSDIPNGSSIQNHSESNKELMSSQAEKYETVIEQEIPLFLTREKSSFEKELPRFYRAADGFELFEFSHSSKSRMASTFASNKMSNSYNYWKLNENNESGGQELTTSPLAKSMACPQKNESDGNISSKELLKLASHEADHTYAQSQWNATNSTQSQVLLSSSRCISVEQNEFVHTNTTSQVTEKNHQELTEQVTPELQATNNEILEISVSNDYPWVEYEIEIASSSQPDTTELLQVLPLQSNDVQTSRNNEVIISNELTDELAASGIYTYTIINGPAEQTKLQPKAYASKPTGSKSIGLIQQAGAPKVSAQITLPSSQSHYARAGLNDKTIQSTSGANPSQSNLVRKPRNKFVIHSNVLIKSSTTNGRMQSDDSTQKPQTQPGKPEFLPTQVAVQSNLKAPVNGKGNVRGHPYAGPTSNKTLIKPNGSTKQPALMVNSHLNLPQEDFSVEVPQGHDVDRVMQKTKKVVQWAKLPQPLPKSKTLLKRKPKENISPMLPKKRSLQEEPGVKINMLDNSGMSFRLPEITVKRIEMVGGVEQKVGVTGLQFKIPFKPISQNKTLTDYAETLLRNNVSVFKLPSKPVNKNYFKILEKNNVRVVKLNKK